MAQSAAQRQKAYRDRRRELDRVRAAVGIPPAPPAMTRPNFARWARLTDTMRTAAAAVGDELDAYIADRSEAWRDGARGEHLALQLETVEGILNQIDELGWEYPE